MYHAYYVFHIMHIVMHRIMSCVVLLNACVYCVMHVVVLLIVYCIEQVVGTSATQRAHAYTLHSV